MEPTSEEIPFHCMKLGSVSSEDGIVVPPEGSMARCMIPAFREL
jgi:hypothetical protein